jgi:hypothetical protein
MKNYLKMTGLLKSLSLVVNGYPEIILLIRAVCPADGQFFPELIWDLFNIHSPLIVKRSEADFFFHFYS